MGIPGILIWGFGIIVYVMLSLTALFLTHVSWFFIFIFYFFSAFILAIILLVKLTVKKVLTPAEKEKQSNVVLGDTEMFKIAKDYILEQYKCEIGEVYVRGVTPVLTEFGGSVPVFALHFRDTDSDTKYIFGLLVEKPSIKFVKKVKNVLTDDELNAFMSSLARGQREVRVITRETTDELGRIVRVKESEPLFYEQKGQKEQVPQTGI